LNATSKVLRSNTVVPETPTRAVNQVISKHTEIRTSKTQIEPALAKLNYEKIVSKATSHVDNRNLRAEEDKWYLDEEQERSEKSDHEQERSEKSNEFKKIEHPGSQEKDSSIVIEFTET
jgi:transcriptional regulator of heat shock response